MAVINATTALMDCTRNRLNRGGSAFEEGQNEKVCEFRAALNLSLPQTCSLTKAK